MAVTIAPPGRITFPELTPRVIGRRDKHSVWITYKPTRKQRRLAAQLKRRAARNA